MALFTIKYSPASQNAITYIEINTNILTNTEVINTYIQVILPKACEFSDSSRHQDTYLCMFNTLINFALYCSLSLLDFRSCCHRMVKNQFLYTLNWVPGNIQHSVKSVSHATQRSNTSQVT